MGLQSLDMLTINPKEVSSKTYGTSTGRNETI
jgi:hypothetical protein